MPGNLHPLHLSTEAPAGAGKEEAVTFSVAVTLTRVFLGPPAVVLALTKAGETFSSSGCA